MRVEKPDVECRFRRELNWKFCKKTEKFQTKKISVYAGNQTRDHQLHMRAHYPHATTAAKRDKGD